MALIKARNALRLRWIPRSGGFWFSVYVLAISGLVGWGCYAIYDKLIEETEISATARNVGLLWGGLIALGLAIWRSFVARQQADTARRSLLNDRYHRAVELLGNEKLHIRIGAIDALKDLAFEDPKEFGMKGATVLLEFAIWAKVMNQPSTEGTQTELMEEYSVKRLQETVRGELFSDGVDYVLAHNAVHNIIGMMLHRGVIDETGYYSVSERLFRLLDVGSTQHGLHHPE